MLKISAIFSSNIFSYTSHFTGLDLAEWPGDVNFAIMQANIVWVGLVTFQCIELDGKNAVEIIILCSKIVHKI